MPNLAWKHSFAGSHGRGQGADSSKSDFGTISAPGVRVESGNRVLVREASKLLDVPSVALDDS